MATPRTFPSIKPSARSYSPGTYPSTDFESLDGTKTHIRFGNKRVNATLTLGFSNITDAEAALIIKNYDDVMSAYDYVEFTAANATAGIIDTGTGDLFRKEIWNDAGLGVTEQGLKWRYSRPPSITSTFRGLSNVSCSFVACLDAPI